MHQTNKGNQWHFGTKAHIGVDAESGLVHTVTTTPANAHDWQVAMMPGKRKALDKASPSNVLKDKLEKIKASIRAKVEHPFRVIKCQFGHRKTRYRGLAKNTPKQTQLLHNRTSVPTPEHLRFSPRFGGGCSDFP